MRTITLEEHYATPAFMEGPGRELKEQAEAVRDHPQVAAGYAKLIEALCDLDDGRVLAMDAAGIDVQVLSLTFPGVEQLEAAEAVAFARQTRGRRPSDDSRCNREVLAILLRKIAIRTAHHRVKAKMVRGEGLLMKRDGCAAR